MPLSLPFQEKAKNHGCYLEFSQIIISENNKYGAGENSKNLVCVRVTDKIKEKIFLHISNDELHRTRGNSSHCIEIAHFKC